MSVHGDNYWLERLGAASNAVVSKTITFDGTTGNGAIGTIDLFTPVGNSLAAVIAISSVDLVSATGNVSVGDSAGSGRLLPATAAASLTAGVVADSTGVTDTPVVTPGIAVLDGDTVQLAIDTEDVTDGTLTVYCFYRTLDKTASLTKI